MFKGSNVSLTTTAQIEIVNFGQEQSLNLRKIIGTWRVTHAKKSTVMASVGPLSTLASIGYQSEAH